MIRLFGQTDTDFTSNGDAVLDPFKAVVHKEDNGDYYLALELPTKWQSLITEGRIIVANTPQGDQAFRVGNVSITDKKITTKCWHVFYDTKKYYYLNDFTMSAMACVDVLNAMNNTYARPASPFTVASDIVELTKYFSFTDMTYYDGIMNLVREFDGHLVRDNFSFSIMDSIGEDKDIYIRYGVNLKEIQKSENWDDVCTKIHAKGKEGITYDGDVYLNPYIFTYRKVVTFSQDNIVRSNYNSKAAYLAALDDDLTSKSLKYLHDHTLPEVLYTLKANMEYDVDIGDTIHVIDENLGVDIDVSVLAYDYDCNLERFNSIEIGNARKSARGIGNVLDNVVGNQAIGATGGKSLVFNDDNTVSWA